MCITIGQTLNSNSRVLTFLARVVVAGSDKRTSLQRYSVDYQHKKSYIIGSGSRVVSFSGGNLLN